MSTFLLIFALILAAGFLYLSRLPKKYEIRRTLVMGAGRAAVFDRIRDLRGWSEWSPWLLHEPGARLDFSADQDQPGGHYTWDGRYIGAGRLTQVRFEAPARIEQRLEITRPYRSLAEVCWELVEAQGGTEVTWVMRSRMPLLLRPLIPMMAEMIGKDFELGLARLRGRIDPDAPRPELRFEGETTLEPQEALVIPFSGGLKEMVQAMESGFPRLMQHLGSGGVTPSGPPFTAYHKVDMKKKHFRCDMALPVSAGLDSGPFDHRGFSGGRHYKVSLTGSYDFLELAWYAAIGHARMLKLRLDKRRPMLEVYETDPASVVDPQEIRTVLYLPLR